jgi:hypothetical protein
LAGVTPVDGIVHAFNPTPIGDRDAGARDRAAGGLHHHSDAADDLAELSELVDADRV